MEVVLAFFAFGRQVGLSAAVLSRPGLKPLHTRPLLFSYLAWFPDSLVCGFKSPLRSRGSGRRLVAAMASDSAAEEPFGKRSWTDVVKTDVEGDGSIPEENLDATHGFTRPEMIKKKPLVGSVDLYERHIFLRHNQPESWPSKVEAPGYDPLPSKLVNAIRSKKNELPKKVCRYLALSVVLALLQRYLALDY